MDASIIQTHDLIQKLLGEGKLKEAGLDSEVFNFFPKNDVNRVINPVHPDIKNACLTRLKEAISLHIRSIYNLSKIGKLSKDEIRPFVVQWINKKCLFLFKKKCVKFINGWLFTKGALTSNYKLNVYPDYEIPVYYDYEPVNKKRKIE